jgi:hypothetical protein
LFTWKWDRICLCQISRTSSIIWNLIQIDHCQKLSSQWYPQMHPSSNWKSPTFQLPCLVTQDLHTVSAQQELHMPVMWAINSTSHTTLKACPGTCIQSQHDSSNFLCRQLVHHQQSQTLSQSATNPKNCKCILHEFHLNNKVLIHPEWHWQSIFGQVGQAYTRFLQDYQWTTTHNQWYCSHTVITDFCWAHQHSPIAAIFWMLQLMTQMLYLSHYDIMMHSHIDTWHHNKISKAHRANKLARDSNCKLDSLSICNLFSTKHISFTWQLQKSL